jgi:hypothetical protein
MQRGLQDFILKIGSKKGTGGANTPTPNPFSPTAVNYTDRDNPQNVKQLTIENVE